MSADPPKIRVVFDCMIFLQADEQFLSLDPAVAVKVRKGRQQQTGRIPNRQVLCLVKMAEAGRGQDTKPQKRPDR